MSRQRPEIPSIGQLFGSPAATQSGFQGPSSQNEGQPASVGAQRQDNLTVPQFIEGTAAAYPGTHVYTNSAPAFSAAMSLEPSSDFANEHATHNDNQGNWLMPPRSPSFGPAAGNRRRSASTGALPSTYCSIPYGIPAEAPIGPQTQTTLQEPFSEAGASMTDQTQSLWDLHDPAEGPAARPHYSLTTLIRYAILGSEVQRLTLQEIYEAIEERYIFFQTAGKGWKNSVSVLFVLVPLLLCAYKCVRRQQVRHNLSLNKCFKRVNRTLL